MKNTPIGRLIALAACLIIALSIGGMVWARLMALSNVEELGQLPDVTSFVVRIYYDDIADLVNLQDYDIWEYNNLEERYVLAAVDTARYIALQNQGWNVTVDLARSQALIPATGSTVDFYGDYRTVDELYDDLAALNAAKPELSELVIYGESHCLAQNGCTTLGGDESEGFPLHALRITNEGIPGSSEMTEHGITKGQKPVFFLIANIHAREITTPEIAMRFIEYLLNGYGDDADATWLVDHHEIWVIPIINPDGHWLVELGQTGKYGPLPFYQRKNANNDTNSDGKPDCSIWPPSTFEQYGIDLNRNHSFGWGPPGSSNVFCNMTYRGPSPGSEVEVAALEALVSALIPDQRGPDLSDPAPDDTTGIFITLHSYSNLVLWPWGNSSMPAPNKPDLKAIGDKFATYNNYLSCQPSECLYLTNGSSDDWAYGVLGVPAFTFEIGNQFMPPYSEIDAIQWPDNKPALIYAAKIARTPYMTVHGPDTLNLVVTGQSPDLIVTGEINDQENGGNPISSAAYSIDAPPWQNGVELHPLNPVDGSFDSSSEAVSGELDFSALTPGKHMLFMYGQDSEGNRGAVSATFFEVQTGWSFQKVALNNYLTPGGTIPYEIKLSLTRSGTNHSYSTEIVDVLPPEMDAIPETIKVNGTIQPGIYDQSTRTLRYKSEGVFDEQWHVSITFAARSSESMPTGQLLANQATVTVLVNNQSLPIQPASAVVPVINSMYTSQFPIITNP